jgi:DeoR family fructose operon transcriptional repressor
VLLQERRQQVLELITRKGFATLADLSRSLGASESTVRRDLDFWQGRGVLKRIHGGAMYTGEAVMPSLEERTGQQSAEKRAIARAAVELIRDGDAILLDGGTTTLEVARLLVNRPLNVVTNSLPIAQMLSGSHETQLVMLGGYVYPKTGVAIGPLVIRMLEEIHVQFAFMSVSGITSKGLFNSNTLLVETERAIMRQANQVIMLADHTKFGRQPVAHLGPLSDIDVLISDPRIPPEYRHYMDEAAVRLIVAPLD